MVELQAQIKKILKNATASSVCSLVFNNWRMLIFFFKLLEIYICSFSESEVLNLLESSQIRLFYIEGHGTLSPILACLVELGPLLH